MKTLYSVNELAERWGLSPQSIRQMEIDGEIHRMPGIPGVKFCLEEIEMHDTMLALGVDVKTHSPYEWRRQEERIKELEAKVEAYEEWVRRKP